MTFDVLSNATSLGHQKAHLSLLNSNISKLIHDQGTLPAGTYWQLFGTKGMKISS